MTVWTVPASVIRVVDGDTLDAILDLGWHISYHAKIRLVGVNAPELGTKPGTVARQFVLDQLTRDPASAPVPVTVVSHLLDKYGRVLASVKFVGADGTEHDLSTDLLASGNAVPM